MHKPGATRETQTAAQVSTATAPGTCKPAAQSAKDGTGEFWVS